MKKIIFEFLSFILIIGALLYLNMFMIMYNVKVYWYYVISIRARLLL